jgi:predicted transcriptional regulator
MMEGKVDESITTDEMRALLASRGFQYGREASGHAALGFNIAKEERHRTETVRLDSHYSRRLEQLGAERDEARSRLAAAEQTSKDWEALYRRTQEACMQVSIELSIARAEIAKWNEWVAGLPEDDS